LQIRNTVAKMSQAAEQIKNKEGTNQEQKKIKKYS